ncbi:NADP-dependent oxidoreductase domain-containing protein [Gaertneriomyces semiglobifer]|nr:NADP-dependent oxidoreductase domain-containing protein [Gaertneriomyces semiglobifer]
MVVKTQKLNTGAEIPTVALGTWKSEPGKVGAAVKTAIEAGYRHIDGALIYQNEKEVGEALKQVFANGTAKREDLFYTSKLWNTFHRPELVAKGLEASLRDLGIDYLDLYLMHWPVAFKPDGELLPKDKSPNEYVDSIDYVETWKAMEKLVDSGKVKAIGVCNFDIPRLEKLLASAIITPAVLQVELHPYLPQPKLIEFCKKHGIVVEAYAPLGSGGNPSVLKDPIIGEIAKKHGKDVGQIVLSWGVQRGTVVLPKSVHEERIKSNHAIVDLTEEDMAKINNIKERHRFVNPTDLLKVDIFKGDIGE